MPRWRHLSCIFYCAVLWRANRCHEACGCLRLLFVVGLLGFGMYNAYTPVVRHQTVFINKKMDKPLRIGVASDLHLGILFGARQLDKLADIMKQEQVDMVLLPGDFDGRYRRRVLERKT